jgi:hypothetical protein
MRQGEGRHSVVGKVTSRTSIVAAGLLLGLLILAACGPTSSDPTATVAPDQPPVSTAEPTPPPEPTPVEPTPASPDTEDPDVYPAPVRAAVNAAAAEAGVEPERILVVSFEDREWPSTALGCPQPGFSYAQVVTPGYFVLLRVDDAEFEYHTNLANSVVLCASAQVD